jgi:hypothetical protein
VHFHLVNVQVINRVGWDGTIKPPAANEVGWKETLRMNPLEDVYVAARAVHPVTPYSLPTSQRLLDPSLGVGGTFGLTNIDPNTGGAPTSQTYLVNGVSTAVRTTQYTNQLTDFDNEYVWHCHILGHEEFDFMRPMIFHPNVQVPDAPAGVTVAGTKVTWVDTTPYGGQDAQGIPTAGTNAAYPEPTSSPKNEIGFNVFDGVTQVNAKPIPANSTSWTSPVALVGPVTVVAYNAAGNSLPGTSATTFKQGTNGAATPPASTPGTNAVTGASIDSTGLVVTVTSTAGYVVGASVSGGGFPQGTVIASINANGTQFTTSVASTTPGVTGQALTISIAAAGALPTPAAAAAPSNLTQTLNLNSLTNVSTVTLNWTPVPGATSYTVTVAETNSTGPVLPVTTTVIVPIAPATTPAATFTTAALNTSSTYVFSVFATTLSGNTATASTNTLTNSPTLAPVVFSGKADLTPGSITLQWANNPANKNNVAGLLLTWTDGVTTSSFPFAATTTGATLTGLTPKTTYGFTLQAVSNVAVFNSPVLKTWTSNGVAGLAASVTAP